MDKPDLSRRAFAAQAAAMGAALAFGTSAKAKPAAMRGERRDLYPQGVASGDPRPDSVILWTRRAPDAGAASHRLTVEVSSDPGFKTLVARGAVPVTAATDWTCRFLAAGLKPSREYWYRFIDEAGNASRVGRTITAPADEDERPVNFVFVSCQDVCQGAMNAYRRMLYEDARKPRSEQLGFVLHLGDFFYELVWYPEDSPGGVDRGRRLRDIVRYPHGEKVGAFHIPTDLEDYRTAYRGYLKDPDLQDARAQWPFVPVWDNHEFSWRGLQSMQPMGNELRPAQKLKVMATQAWYEYQPARVKKAGPPGDVYVAPVVENKPLTDVDARGVWQEPNNLAAIKAVQIQRAFKYGKNVDMIITDNRSFMSPGGEYTGLPEIKFGAMPEELQDILDQGSAYAGGHPPATLKLGDAEFPNPNAKSPPEAYLGIEQMAWFKGQLRAAKAPWKIWGHSFGTLTQRTDPQNLPEAFAGRWPKGATYGVIQGGYSLEHGEIFDMVREEGITGLTIVAGDKHSFWAVYPSKSLPPRPYDPVAVEFITGSISAQGAAEVNEITMPKDRPLRPLYIHDRPDGTMGCSYDMTVLHGVKSSLVLKETNDPAKARAASNPELSPHLKFVDHGGHGYAVVRASPKELATEFVCIPRPLERAATEDGGPLRYRVVHRVSAWKPGETPQMRQEILEGDVGLSI